MNAMTLEQPERKTRREPAPGDLRFMALARELKLPIPDLARLRAEHLCDQDYYEVGQAKWFTAEGAAKLRVAVAVPLAVPKRHEARVLCAARNPKWVFVAIPGNDRKQPVAIPRKLIGKLVGKKIFVDEIKDEAGGVSYRHADLTTI